MGWPLSDFLTVFGNAIWVGAAGAGIFFGLKSDIRQLRSDIKNAVEDNQGAHEGFKERLRDHEDRMRQIERAAWLARKGMDG
jgi:hypothetical protein